MSEAKSWRDQIKVHPAAELFPMMTPDEQKPLGDDIEQHGLRTNIAVWRADDGRPWFLLDGRNRLDAAELVGLPVTFIKKDGEVTVKIGNHVNAVDDITSMDPYEWVISANVHRRHLTPEQKRDVIAALLKANPEKSNRQLAETVKASHVTVGAVRAELRSTGQIDQLTKTVGKDGKARKQPTTNKPKDPAIVAANRAEARTPKKPRRAKPNQRPDISPLMREVIMLVEDLTNLVDYEIERIEAFVKQHYAALDPDGCFCLRQFAESNSAKLNMLASALLDLEVASEQQDMPDDHGGIPDFQWRRGS